MRSERPTIALRAAILGAFAAVSACDAITGLGRYDKCIDCVGATPGDETGTVDDAVADVEPGIDAKPPEQIDKVDLLVVVDNSISMADKQSELARRIPSLIARLTDPMASKRAVDIHVGVITSSLGSHGTSACATEITNRANDDRGHLLPRAGEAGGKGWDAVTASGSASVPLTDCPSPVAASAISWVFKPEADPSARFKGHPDGAKQLEVATSCVLASAKEQGCGYEATWEAMYHFLVDPAPYAKAEVKCTFGISGDVCGTNKIEVSGVDETLLTQRRSFLRPDSVLVVVVLSDENDFSLRPAELNWRPWGLGKGKMPRGWAGCATVPDDFEPETAAELTRLRDDYKCVSCLEDSSNPNCATPWATSPLNNDVDGRNLRGFNQVLRYGSSFLWNRQRYVHAFTKAVVPGSDGRSAPNPIFSGQRTLDMVIVAAIVGVPNALVTDSSLAPKPSLTESDWDRIVGPIGKRDLHMIESIAPRVGVPKYSGDRMVDKTNGGDRDVADGDDLQYACIGPRSVGGSSYDCDGPDPAKGSPLCAADGTQPYLKAYPGLRHLRIVRDLGTNGIVGSICASSYEPFSDALAQKILGRLR